MSPSTGRRWGHWEDWRWRSSSASGDRPVPRGELAEVLWGEDLPPTWEPSLRAVLSRVRRRLGVAGLPGEVIAGGGGCYQLHVPTGTVIDVEQAALDLGAARAAWLRGGWAEARHLAAAAEVAGRLPPGATRPLGGREPGEAALAAGGTCVYEPSQQEWSAFAAQVADPDAHLWMILIPPADWAD